MSNSLAIPAPMQGRPMPFEMDAAAVAREMLGTDRLAVIRARALPGSRIYVMHIDDWGLTKGLALNRRAWAMYGASPVYGLAVLSADDGEPIDDEVIDVVHQEDWPNDETMAAMDRWLEEHQ